jgi:hypothetical protein
MAETERPETKEQRATRLLGQFKADVLRLALADPYGDVGYVVIVGLLDVAEGLMRRNLRHDPAPLPILLTRIDDLRANVLRVGSPPVVMTPTQQH